MAGGRRQTNVHLNEPTTDAVLVYVKKSTGKIYVQRIVYSPGGYIAGTVLNFVDSVTQAVLGTINVVAPAIQTAPYVLDFAGPFTGSAAQAGGTPLSTGANLQLAILSGGCTGRLVVQSYQLPLY